MANHTHKSGGGNGMKVDIDITDYTEEITAGIKAAIKRALIRIGLEVEVYAKRRCMWLPADYGTVSPITLRGIPSSSAVTWNMPDMLKKELQGLNRIRICALLSQITWTSGSKSLLWACYRGGTPDFTRGGYHFFTLCTVSLERIANLPNGIMGRKKPWKSEKWARNSTAFCFLENSSEVSFRNGFCFYRRLTAFSQSNRSRYTRRTMLERLQVRGYAQEIMPNSWMNFKITVT